MIYYLKAGATDNIQGLPTEWPVKVQKADGVVMETPWILATMEELEEHKKSYEKEYKAWKNQRDALEKASKERKKEQRQRLQNSAEMKLGELGFDEEEIKYIIGKYNEN